MYINILKGYAYINFQNIYIYIYDIPVMILLKETNEHVDRIRLTL